MRFLVLALVFVVGMVGVAEARPKRGSNYSYSMPVYSQPTKTYGYTSDSGSMYNGDDQSRCQAEADYMASRGITGHVGSCIGSFEGVGYGSSPNCQTCTPSNRMTLTGDASAQGRNGMWYRVRSWR